MTDRDVEKGSLETVPVLCHYPPDVSRSLVAKEEIPLSRFFIFKFLEYPHMAGTSLMPVVDSAMKRSLTKLFPPLYCLIREADICRAP